jgi:3-hydroxyacyl-[acyl-carrier-protein] dehydratase
VRFLCYDRVSLLEKGSRIEGVKTFALAEEHHRDHFAREPVVPSVMLLEAMAQLLGWGVIHAHDFRLTAIMTLVEGVTFPRPRLRPGFAARVVGEIVSTSATDSLGRAFMEADGQRIATVERLIFKHFPVEDPEALAALFGYCSGLPAASFSPGGAA